MIKMIRKDTENEVLYLFSFLDLSTQITKEDKTKIYAWTITCNSDDLRFPVWNSNDDRADRNRTLFIDQI